MSTLNLFCESTIKLFAVIVVAAISTTASANTYLDMAQAGNTVAVGATDFNEGELPNLTVYAMHWTGAAGYEMIGRFAYDPSVAPPVISASFLGPTNGLEYLDVSFRDPVGNFLQADINVENGISTYYYTQFSFDTVAGSMVGDLDIGRGTPDISDDLFLSGSFGQPLPFQLNNNNMQTFDTGDRPQLVQITDTLELNDTFASATPIGCKGFFFPQSTINPLGDLDVYRLEATPGVKARIDLGTPSTSSLDTLLGVYDSSGTLLVVSDDDAAPGETPSLDSYLDVTVPADGVLFIMVTAYADFDFDGLPGDPPFSTGNYTIFVNCAFAPGHLYASTGGGAGAGSDLFEIDPATGASTFLADIPPDLKSTELEFGASGTFLFVSTGHGPSELFIIFAADLSVGTYCTHQQGALNALEFVGDTLYATYKQDPGGPSSLVIVNPPVQGTCALDFIGPTGVLGGIGGLAYDTATETMYGCSVRNSSPSPGQLLEINLTTGLATPVGAPNIGATGCSALEFSSPATGTESLARLYAGIGRFDPVSPGFLFEVFPANGSGVPVGPTGFPGISGLAFAPGPVADLDNDGVVDTLDNCTSIPNIDQRDTNSDGFGNICDADLNNDCEVNFLDLAILKANFFAVGDLDTDFDGDGRTNFVDLSIMKKHFFTTVGPSAYPCGIANPSFETGDFTGWTVVDHPLPFFPLTVDGAGVSPGFDFFLSDPTEGTFAALHGFDGDVGSPASITIGQDVFVVPDKPVLRADYRVAWNLTDFCGGCADRTFRLNIYTPGGEFLLDSREVLVLPANTTNIDTGNLLAEIDLGAFAGMAVFINFEFEVPDESSGPAFLQLDNVRFEP